MKTLSADIGRFLDSMEGREKKKKSREKILDLLREHPEYSTARLAEQIGVTSKAVEKQLARLKAEGLVQRIGPDKGGRWEVIRELLGDIKINL